MDWQINDSVVKKWVVILVFKQEYCFYDLLVCWQVKEFDIEIFCVIFNYDIFCGFVEWYGIFFYYVLVNVDNKKVVYVEIQCIFDDVCGDFMVFVCYMQIFLLELCDVLFGKIINIYYFFLFSFVGVKFYYQVYVWGVKLIGVICYYVISEFDVGLIIEQDVICIDYFDLLEDMVCYGKDIEKIVFVCGLCYYLEDWVLVYGNKIVVFC